MQVQSALYTFALMLPIYLAIRFPFRGSVIGGLVFWFLVGGASLLNPHSIGLGWVFIIFWLAFGWPIGIAYSAVTSTFIKLVWQMLRGRAP